MNKFKKSKVVGITVASLMAVASATVGFSAWVASGKQNAQTSDVTVTVGDVKDQRVSLSVKSIDYAANSGIFFDADKTGLSADSTSPLMPGDKSTPNLTFTVKLNCKIGDDTTAFNGISAWMEVKTSLSADKYASTSNESDTTTYFIAPANVPFGKSDNDKKTLFAKDAKTIAAGDNEFEFTCTFLWGGFFGGKNPTLSATDENLDSYITALKELKEKKPTFVVHLIAD